MTKPTKKSTTILSTWKLDFKKRCIPCGDFRELGPFCHVCGKRLKMFVITPATQNPMDIKKLREFLDECDGADVEIFEAKSPSSPYYEYSLKKSYEKKQGG